MHLFCVCVLLAAGCLPRAGHVIFGDERWGALLLFTMLWTHGMQIPTARTPHQGHPPTLSNPPIKHRKSSGRTDSGWLGLVAGADGAGAANPPSSSLVGYAPSIEHLPDASTPHPHRLRTAPPHRVTMLADWVDDVASALRLRRAPLLPLSSSDRPRSHIRCDGFWILGEGLGACGQNEQCLR